MTHALDIQQVTRSFGRTAAVDNVSFQVPENSIVGLLGRNGAGKTTLMSMLAGQDRPDTGTVTVLGDKVFERANTLSGISYVRDNQRYPDNYMLHHVLRIAPAFKPNWSRELADELVDGFRIPAKTKITKMSRGQLSSVAIVLSLASRAPITLLDEPYLGLDVTGRALFHRVLLDDYQTHPRTIVLSTHLIEESAALLDRVVIMDKGRIVVDDETENARDGAFVASGQTDAVGRLLVNHRILETHTVGALASVTAAGTLDDTLRQSARVAGVQLARASLQELVSAYGVNESTSETKEKVRA
ncbi:ABC transporter ATP-binding protein [Homoserinimonas sp. OAct 916]|uniref:ABC transporter ATP-binding protein n=1 Tax=Homoserinimonas sp. OAct 916 TaxID=2211450 RepID=UPI000DBE07B6|nr:ABC transporter ATP-binding protein [Homoserinimonas sp. OAct 916]